jgi:hypothetical protein
MDEFYKIASEKGWIVKKAEEEGLEFPASLVHRKRYGEWVKNLQTVMRTFVPDMPVSDPSGPLKGEPDGKWGRLSAAAWNALTAKTNELRGDWVLTPVAEDGSQLPSGKEVNFVLSGHPSGSVKSSEQPSIERSMFTDQQWAMLKGYMKERGITDPRQALEELQVAHPDVFEKEPKAMSGKVPAQAPVKQDPEDLIKAVMGRNKYMTREDAISYLESKMPGFQGGSPADDGVVTASVIGELLSLAGDLEKMGEVEAAMAVDEQITIYKEALEKLYDVTGETGEQLVEQAHPGGGPTIAPSKEEGGKVETIVEEQKKNIDKATKKPTGKYAELVNNLIATANSLEGEGRVEEAEIVDQTLRDLLETPPFVSRSAASETAGSEDSGISDLKKEAAVPVDNAKLIKKWEAMIKLQSKFHDLLFTFTMGAGGGVPWKVGYVFNAKKAWDKATDYLNGIAADWKVGSLNNKMLAARAAEAHKKYFWDEETVRDIMDGLYLRDKSKLAGEKVYYRFINSLKAFVDAAEASATKKSPVPIKTEEFARNDRKKIYIDILNDLDNYMRQNQQQVIFFVGDQATYDKLAKLIRNQRFLIEVKNKAPSFNQITSMTKWVKKLKAYKHKGAASVYNMMVTSDLGAPSFGPKVTPTKPGGRKSKSVKKDPLVRKFQLAVMALYGPDAVGPKKDDGEWGPRTKAAYEKVMNDIRKAKPTAGVYAVTATQPTPSVLNWGTRVATWLTKQKGTAAGLSQDIDIPYNDKISFKLRELASAKTFLATLAGLRTQKLLTDVHAGEEAKEAFTMLAKLYNKLSKDKEYRENLEFSSRQVGIADKVGKVVFNTFNQLYRIPGGKKSYEELVKAKKAPTAPGTKPAVPASRLDLSWVNPAREKEEKLDTPNKVIIAIRSLPFMEYLVKDMFESVAVSASKYDEDLRGFWGKDVSHGSETPEQLRELSKKFLTRLYGRVRRLIGALSNVQGEFLTQYSKKSYLNFLYHMQDYLKAMGQLREAL